MNQTKRTLLIALILISAWTSPISAQSGAYAEIALPSYQNFPQISTYLDVYNTNDHFIHGLTAQNIQLKENGQPRPVDEFVELSPGVQLVIAVNIAPPFAIQDISGQSRWGYIQNYLTDWISGSSKMGKDDLSIITNDGLERTHLRDQEPLLNALNDYQPQPRDTSPNLNVLASAIDIAQDPLPEKGMKRVILFMTPSPSAEEITAIQNLTSRAQDGDVRIFSWLVAPQESFSSPGAEQLQKMAQATKGGYFAFSGVEEFPDMPQVLSALRGSYLVKYRSQISSSAPHQLEMTIDVGEETITTSKELAISIQPPNPILLTPPLEIQRTHPKSDQESTSLDAYQPQVQPLEMIVEFPDGHPRPLEKTVLIVDGESVQTNTSPPFERFTWDLTQYERDQTHYLSVHAVDSLGLNKTSVQTPVEVTVNRPQPSISNIFQEHPMGFLSMAGVLLFASLIFFLISQGFIYPRSLFSSSQAKEISRPQPDKAVSTGERKPLKIKRILGGGNVSGTEDENAYATLHPYNEEAQERVQGGIPLSREKITFGKNPQRVTAFIDHPTISDQHAHLTIDAEGEISLSDAGSEAGTWVNFQQIPSGYPVHVQDGDIIHFGKIGFLLELDQPDTHKDLIIAEENAS